MKYILLKKLALFISLSLAISSVGVAQQKTRKTLSTSPQSTLIEERNVRAQMEFLASDALQGRGSGTQFELLAGQYIASQLQQFGVEPAGDSDAAGNKTYIQTVNYTPRRRGGNSEQPQPQQPPQTRQTWNALGKITGTDAKLGAEVILLSAHMDHLGLRPNAPGEDKIFNGADDDASGCVAVLELARVLAKGKRPKRTVYFVFFGSEEAGGYGARHFVENLPFPKEKLVANLEFEMIGRPDAKVAADQLWLTGYERSNLGAELARQGAKLVADPHPEENFFQRSDNFTLARQGIIAHTVSSFGLHTDYHRASDEVKTIDFKHMTSAISSMVKPVQWLVNSNFKPTWYEGKKP